MQQRGPDEQDQPDYGQSPQFGDRNPYTGQQPQWTQQPGQPPQSGPYVSYQPPQAPKKNTGWKIAGFGCLGLGVIIAIVFIAAAAVGTSNGTSVNTTAAGNTDTGAAGASSTPATRTSAGVGDAIDVTDSSGDKLAVTLVKVDAKTTSTDGFSSPTAGDQYYAAQFQIKNVGSTAWSDAPSNCVVVKDGKGQTFQSTIVQSISSGPLMAITTNVAAGDSTLGWIVFEIPTGDRVVTVQFTPDSGMGLDTAQWGLA